MEVIELRGVKYGKRRKGPHAKDVTEHISYPTIITAHQSIYMAVPVFAVLYQIVAYSFLGAIWV